MLTKRQLEDAARCSRTKHNSCALREICFIQGTCYAIIELAQTALAYREMLERLEWSATAYKPKQLYNYCPWCLEHKDAGHAQDCELAALLKESESEEG